MARTPVAEPSGSIYRLRVVLAGITPDDLASAGGPRLDHHRRSARGRQVAFGWSGQHLHRFTVYGKEYGICYDRGGVTFDDDPPQVLQWRGALRASRAVPREVGLPGPAPGALGGGPPPPAWPSSPRFADAPENSTVREVLGEAMEELPDLLYWSRIDCFDRAAVNRGLAEHPTKGAQL